MRNTIVVTATAIFLMTGWIGCKSAPKMPWAKTAAISDVESETLAHTAPSLPADVAKQAEALATTTPAIDLTASQTAGGLAAPYSPAAAYPPMPAYSSTTAHLAATATPSPGSGAKSTPTAYPSTGAPPYSTAPVTNLAATTPPVPPAFQPTDRSADLGPIDMPYNPNAVPPAKTVVSTTAPVTPSVGASRYGSSSVASSVIPSTPAYGQATMPLVQTAALPQSSGGARYGGGNGGDRYGRKDQTATIAPTTPTRPAPMRPTTPTLPPAAVGLASSPTVVPSTPPAYNASATMSGDRYATSNLVTPTASSVTEKTPMTSAPATPLLATPSLATGAPSVASAPAYRPGGTTSYAGLAAGQPAAEIASRTKPTGQQVLNVATPGTTPEPSQAPRYR